MSKKGCVIKHSKWIHIGFGEAEGQGLEMESLSSGELSWLEVFFQQQLIVNDLRSLNEMFFEEYFKI